MNSWIRDNKGFIFGIFVLLITRASLADHYRVPSGSMEPTIQIGDHLFVNKLAYDIRLPLTDIAVLRLNEPRRGEVIVFGYPRDPSQAYVKRLVGLPGDRIHVEGGVVWVNGERHPETESPEASFDRRLDGDWIVPEDSYFMMGDHRDNSADSRDWGFVKRALVKGRAEFLLWNASFSGISLSRWGEDL